MTKIINLFAGPGAGKSTTAAGLFHKMKLQGESVEYVQEFAKDLTWSAWHNALDCQSYVFGQQLWRIERLIGKVDYIITDSPLLLSLIYKPKDYPNSFDNFVLDMFNKYDNINFYLIRKKKYISIGRNQTEDEAKVIDEITKSTLNKYEIPYLIVEGTEEAVNLIRKYL